MIEMVLQLKDYKNKTLVKSVQFLDKLNTITTKMNNFQMFTVFVLLVYDIKHIQIYIYLLIFKIQN